MARNIRRRLVVALVALAIGFGVAQLGASHATPVHAGISNRGAMLIKILALIFAVLALVFALAVSGVGPTVPFVLLALAVICLCFDAYGPRVGRAAPPVA